MAAITPVDMAGAGTFKALRTAATTSQVDWINVPRWAARARVYLSVTTAGTNTQLDILDAEPISRDDGEAALVFAGATITVATQHVYIVVDSGGADGTDSATADADVVVVGSLPALLGLDVAATGSTYDLSIEFLR